MNLLLFIWNIILIMISLGLFFRLFLYKEQIKNITDQLRDLRLRNKRKLILKIR